jgi:hypothetical protein
MKSVSPSVFPTQLHRLCGFALTTAALLAARPSAAVIYGSAVASDLANPFVALSFVNPGIGFAQQFTITSGNWSVTQAQINLGMQDPSYPVTPVLQVRNAAGAGGGPGATLGSFTVNPNDIPPWIFGVNNFGIVTAPAAASFELGPGTYWLCVMNTSSLGGFMDGYATANPLVQTGIAGNVSLSNGVQATSDGGNSFAPANFGDTAMLIELDAQPVPEPSAGSLVLLGLCGLLVRALRRRAASHANARA